LSANSSLRRAAISLALPLVTLTATRLRTFHRVEGIGSALNGSVNVCHRQLINNVLGPLVAEFVRNFGCEGATPIQRDSNASPLGRVQRTRFKVTVVRRASFWRMRHVPVHNPSRPALVLIEGPHKRAQRHNRLTGGGSEDGVLTCNFTIKSPHGGSGALTHKGHTHATPRDESAVDGHGPARIRSQRGRRDQLRCPSGRSSPCAY